MMLKRKDKLLQKELESTDVGPSSTETAPAKNWVQDTPLWRVGTAIAIALGVYHFATSFVGIPQAWLHRAIHMMLVLLLAYISFGKVKKPIRYLEKGITVGFLCLAFVYILVYYNDIQLRAAFPTTLDLVIGTGLVALVIVACWRYVGPAMAWVIIAFCLYAVLGFLLPGRLKAPQLTFPYMISYLFNSNFALMGSTTGVAATSVVMFVFFGALLDKSGAMKVFSDISIMATRRITAVSYTHLDVYKRQPVYHVPIGRPTAVKDAVQVGAQHPAVVRIRHIAEKACPRDAGVTYQNVKLTKNIQHIVNQRLGLAGIGHVGLKGPDRISRGGELLHQGAGFGFGAVVVDRYRIAGGGKCAGHRRTDTPAAASDQNRLLHEREAPPRTPGAALCRHPVCVSIISIAGQV